MTSEREKEIRELVKPEDQKTEWYLKPIAELLDENDKLRVALKKTEEKLAVAESETKDLKEILEQWTPCPHAIERDQLRDKLNIAEKIIKAMCAKE